MKKKIENEQKELCNIIQYHELNMVVDVPDPDEFFNKVVLLVESLGGTCVGSIKEGEWDYEKDL